MENIKEPIKDESIKMNPTFKRMLASGVPVYYAEFHNAVNNSDNVPENFFSRDSQVKSRNVDMFWIPMDGILCHHKAKYFMVPSSNVKMAKFDIG